MNNHPEVHYVVMAGKVPGHCGVVRVLYVKNITFASLGDFF